MYKLSQDNSRFHALNKENQNLDILLIIIIKVIINFNKNNMPYINYINRGFIC